jgi:hypothetical protein
MTAVSCAVGTGGCFPGTGDGESSKLLLLCSTTHLRPKEGGMLAAGCPVLPTEANRARRLNPITEPDSEPVQSVSQSHNFRKYKPS